MPLNRAVPASAAWGAADNGFVAWASDPSLGVIANQIAMVSGTQYVTRVKVASASAITAAVFYLGTAATLVTEGTADLFDAAGVSIASGDMASAITSTGIKTITFTTPTGVRTVGETLYVGLRATFTGTAPAVRGPSTASLGNINVSGAANRFGTQGTGITSAAASITPASITFPGLGNHCHWVALK